MSAPPDDDVDISAADHDHAWSRVARPRDPETHYRDAPVLLYRCDVCGLTWSLD
jgi:hypothetical protein